MNKQDTVIFSTILLIMALGFTVTRHYVLAVLLFAVTFAIIFSACRFYRVTLQHSSIILVIGELILMLFDKKIPAVIHLFLILYGSLAYSLVASEPIKEMQSCVRFGLLTCVLACALFLFITMTAKFVLSLSFRVVTSYLPILFSLLLTWLLSYFRIFVLSK